MAQFLFHDVKDPPLHLCPHKVVVKNSSYAEVAEDAEKWMADTDRPGFYFWTMEHLEIKNRWALNLSDPNLAFEAKIRWG